MKILDKYILKKFLNTFFFVVFLMVLVISVIDYTEKTQDFLRHNLSFAEVVSQYYLNYIPFMASTLGPIAVFITVVFVTARLSAHSEITAMLTSGVSLKRLLMPYMMGALLLSILIFLMVGWVTPNSAKKKVAFEIAYIKRPFYYNDKNIHFRTSDSTYVYIESYNNRLKKGYKFTLEKFKNKDLVEKLSSRFIQWDTVKNKWHLDVYSVYTFDGKNEHFLSADKLDTNISLTPKYFDNNYNLHETLNIDELNTYIEEQQALGVGNTEQFLHELNERYAYPYAVIILTIMGVMVAVKKSRQGTSFQIAIGFLFAFIYILFAIMSRSIAVAGSLHPSITAWIPNVTFSVVVLTMYFYTTK